MQEKTTFNLANFEGPLSFLLYLVQESEIDLTEVSLWEITEQYIKELAAKQSVDVNAGSEFIDYTSLLLWLKSKSLLPPQDDPEGLEGLEEGSPFGIIPQLLEYVQYKHVAKQLALYDDKGSSYFTRGVTSIEGPYNKPLGIEHVSIADLAHLFGEMLAKSDLERKLIEEETWRIGDKIRELRHLLKTKNLIHFPDIFSVETPTRGEIIVTFLAVLELMKIGELCIGKDKVTERLLLMPPAPVTKESL